MSVIGGQDIARVRRRHLAALAYELELRGLTWRLAGPGESVLSVRGARSGRGAMVVATPTGDGWAYLWPCGGMADVTAAPQVADRLARLLG
ncbi:hypothetical protein BJF79_45930 [Actinomadura sp. CNU-125]|uniref:hypothetical protein n=1 Tax=Actinomadura sp. CNU-125 TaxID=1904961 RepID=UPI000964C42C|nr:hypothetical protein [Actinomadura sp. CNU-125]OLT23606.1 hypothetical protein BJF79_45930 [Actinomadura sp. CNU-125]